MRTHTANIAAILLCSCIHVSTGAALFLSQMSNMSNALSLVREVYTTNAICAKKNCVNPIFPGMEDLHRLENAQWIASTLQRTAPHMGFCKKAITYDPALPSPAGGGATTTKQMVYNQDNAAATMFYYHAAGLGIDAWQYRDPENANDCIKSIWRMTCFTYFPKPEHGKQEHEPTKYLRPCKSSCTNYVRQCNVECCDESVQCVFEHSKALPNNKKLTTFGYVPYDGPSALCTGATRRSATPLGVGLGALAILQVLLSLDGDSVARGFRSLCGGRRCLFVLSVVTLAFFLQGCDYDVPTHGVGAWRQESDYLLKAEYVPPGGSANQAQLNSCSLQRLSATLQCSGRGVCRMWHKADLGNDLSFCDCDVGWADPECRTPRKSQAKAYVLSLFFGMFGIDQFYLGFPSYGIAKLFTFGGFGIWYVIDVIRIGSAPVQAAHFMTAADLPHWVFVLTCVSFACLCGFIASFKLAQRYRSQKSMEALLLQQDEENRQGEINAGKLDKGYGSMKMPMMPPTSMGGFRPMPMGSMGPMASMRP